MTKDIITIDSDWLEFEKKVNEFIFSSLDEVCTCYKALNWQNAVRAFCSILIIFIDTLTKIWDLFYFRNRGNKNRITEWYNEFIATEKNTYRNDNKNIQMFNCDMFYSLRNSLLHSFALPKSDEAWFSIALQMNVPDEYIEAIKSYNSVVISPVDLFNLIKYWWNLMLNYMKDIKESDTVDYYKRISNDWKELEKEWAINISKEEMDDILDIYKKNI